MAKRYAQVSTSVIVTAVLKNQDHWLRGTIFVDAFAGPGLSRVRTKPKSDAPAGLFATDAESDNAEIEFLKGSPRVALDIENPFSAYAFIDNDKRRIAELNALKVEYGATRNLIGGTLGWIRHGQLPFREMSC